MNHEPSKGFKLTPEALEIISLEKNSDETSVVNTLDKTQRSTEDGVTHRAPVLDVKNLKVVYGTHEAVKGISFQVYPGEVLGVLGHNGAGKSSTMKRIAGGEAPSAGTISVSGYHLTDPFEVNKALKLLGYCPDLGGLIPSASPRDHMELTLKIHKKTHLRKAIQPLLRDFDLLKREHSPSKTLSHGEKRRLSVLLAVLASETLLILDEPFDGVDPHGTELTQAFIQEAKDNGLGIVLSTHLQQVLAKTVDRVIVIDDGLIVAEGPASDFVGEEGEAYYKSILKSNRRARDIMNGNDYEEAEGEA